MVHEPRRVYGPSPRGRGNPARTAAPAACRRSIPAWAGKPSSRSSWPRTLRVHPRVGGETYFGCRMSTLSSGPSPRGRGNLQCLASSYPPRPVHPRVGGETPYDDATSPTVLGPSPRGRGNLWGLLRVITTERSIPAWAGKPPRVTRGCWRSRVHPRVGGETCGGTRPLIRRRGPSPRGRGNLLQREAAGRQLGSIPAWAGKPSTACGWMRQPRVHPRVGGETSDASRGDATA